MHVMQLTQQYDIILGNAFLIQTQAVSEYDAQGLKRLVLKRGNRKFSVNRPALGMRQECLAPIMLCYASWYSHAQKREILSGQGYC